MPQSRAGNASRPISTTGIGLRHCHIDYILENRPKANWFELLFDNHTEAGGPIQSALETIRQDYAFTFHCVGMSLGSVDPVDYSYLKKLKQHIQRLAPTLVSDHLSFSKMDGQHYHELLPLPYTEESLQHISLRIQQVQEYLGQQILVENVSSYLTYTHSTIPEWEFFSALAKQADCRLLLDINNIYVNSVNHRFNPVDYLQAISYEHVSEIHLAGFDDRHDYLLDAHNHPISKEVWHLFEQVMQKASHLPTLIEWDNDIPEFTVLMDEAHKAENIRQQSMQLLSMA